MMRLLQAFIFMLFTATTVYAQDKAVDDPEGAMAFIQNLSEETHAVWSDSTMSADDRTQAFRALFQEATDIELLSKGMLGRHYRTASSGQRKAYMDAMRDYIINELDKQMQTIGFKRLDVTGTTPASGRSGHLFVRTKVDREEGQALLADWRVRKKEGNFQIVNLEVEGINLLITNREIFSARVKKIGLDGLISELVASVKNEKALVE